MSQPLVIAGAKIRIFINNVAYSVAQSASLDVDLGTYPTFGINSPYAQSIDSGQVSVKGSIKGVRIKNSGGLQGVNAIPLFSDIAAGNYISLRVEDRQTGETLYSIPKCRVSRVTETVATKGLYQVSFDYIGQIVYWPLDLS